MTTDYQGPAFLPTVPLPLTILQQSTSTFTPHNHHNSPCHQFAKSLSLTSSPSSRWRASATMEPPKDDNENHDEDIRSSSNNDEKSKSSGDNTDEDLEQKRKDLDNIFGLDLSASNKDDVECSCIWCSGTGGRPCTWCRATGFREERITRSWSELELDIQKKQRGEPVELPEKKPVQCSACSGFKMLRCRYCRGSGKGIYGFAYK